MQGLATEGARELLMAPVLHARWCAQGRVQAQRGGV